MSSGPVGEHKVGITMSRDDRKRMLSSSEVVCAARSQVKPRDEPDAFSESSSLVEGADDKAVEVKN